MILLLMIVMSETVYTLYPESTMESPRRHFISMPTDMTTDGKYIYMLDSEEKKIFVWDEHDWYAGTVGRSGQGPGEFTFISPAVSGLTHDGTYLIVLDERKLHFFRDRCFSHSITLGEQGLKFIALNNGKYLHLTNREVDGQAFYTLNLVEIVNRTIVVKKEVLAQKNPMFTRNPAGGWDIRFHAGNLQVSGNYTTDYFLVGNFKSPMMTSYANDGQKLKTTRVLLFAQPFTQAMREETRQLYPWLDPPNKAIWPEEGLTYHQFCVIDNNKWLVAQTVEDHSSGLIYHKDGSFSPFRYDLKEGQFFILDGGQIMAVQQEGLDYVLKRMVLKARTN